MATYYWNYNGKADDSGNGLTAATAFKHHPEMPAFSGTCPLANDDNILAVNTAQDLILPDSTGILPRANINNINYDTAPGEDREVYLDYRVRTFPAWEDMGANVWRANLGSTQYASRFFISDEPINQAADVSSLSPSRPFYSLRNSGFIYLYALANPSTLYGTDMCFVRVNGPLSGLVALESNPFTDHTYQNLHIAGAAIPIYIRGGHDSILVQDCKSLMWGQHGMRSIGNATPPSGDIGIPNTDITFSRCLADMLTKIDEFPTALGERGGDSFAMDGPHLRPRMLNCHSQDQHHSAFQMQAFNTFINGVDGYLHGIVDGEIGYCTADDSGSFFGRLIGCVGRTGLTNRDYPNVGTEIHNNYGTNMKTRSQISGEDVDVHHNNFSNVAGSIVTGGSLFGSPVRGEGLACASSDSTANGRKGLLRVRIFENFFDFNSLPGLRMTYGAASGDGGNEVFNNIISGNNLIPDPEETDIHNVQLHITGNIPADDVYTENNIAGADPERAVAIVTGGYEYFNVSEFDAERALNTLHSTDVTRPMPNLIALNENDEAAATAAIIASGLIPGNIRYEYCQPDNSTGPGDEINLDDPALSLDEVTSLDEII